MEAKANVRIPENESLQAHGRPCRVNGAQFASSRLCLVSCLVKTVGGGHVGGIVMRGGWCHNRFDAFNPFFCFVGLLVFGFLTLLSRKCLDTSQGNNSGHPTHDQKHREANPRSKPRPFYRETSTHF
jgi:hypothetical protein